MTLSKKDVKVQIAGIIAMQTVYRVALLFKLQRTMTKKEFDRIQKEEGRKLKKEIKAGKFK